MTQDMRVVRLGDLAGADLLAATDMADRMLLRDAPKIQTIDLATWELKEIEAPQPSGTIEERAAEVTRWLGVIVRPYVRQHESARPLNPRHKFSASLSDDRGMVMALALGETEAEAALRVYVGVVLGESVTLPV